MTGQPWRLLINRLITGKFMKGLQVSWPLERLAIGVRLHGCKGEEGYYEYLYPVPDR
jgi:hypothetical protein